MDAKDKLLSALRNHFDNMDEAEKFIIDSVKILKNEMGKLKNTSENEEGLLQDLITKGIIPSFSFPLDVVKFEVRGTKFKNGSNSAQEHIYATSDADLKVGLSSFSPGKIIVINKQSFKVEGFGLSFPEHPVNQVESLKLVEEREIFSDEHNQFILNPNIKSDWKYYHRCKGDWCGVIYRDDGANFNTKENPKICKNCEGQDKTEEERGKVVSHRMIRPEVFRPVMHSYSRHGKPYKETPNVSWFEMKASDESGNEDKDRKIGRASLPQPKADNLNEGMENIWSISENENEWKTLTVQVFNDDGDEENPVELITVNEGPNGNGYHICSQCGYIPTGKSKSGGHNRPYAIDFKRIKAFANMTTNNENQKKDLIKKLIKESKNLCNGEIVGPFVFGHTFSTDLVVFRFKLDEPLSSKWDNSWFRSAITTVKEALITSTTEILEVMDREISGNFRKVTISNSENTRDQYIDIFLYDNVSGGAGLVKRIGTENRVEEILDAAYRRLGGDNCGKTPCEKACLNCLLDFRNQREQGELNRPLGFQLINTLRYGEEPDFELTSISKKGIESNKQTVQQKEILEQIYENYDFELKEGYLNISKNGNCKIINPHSILMGIRGLPSNSVNFKKSIVGNEGKIINIPYEILNDSPHVIRDIMEGYAIEISDEDIMDLF